MPGTQGGGRLGGTTPRGAELNQGHSRLFPMAKQYFRVDVRDFIAEVVLNRPQQLNVVDFGFFEELARHLREAEGNDNVRVVIVWAEGKLFTAGLDLKSAQRDVFASGAPLCPCHFVTVSSYFRSSLPISIVFSVLL